MFSKVVLLYLKLLKQSQTCSTAPLQQIVHLKSYHHSNVCKQDSSGELIKHANKTVGAVLKSWHETFERQNVSEPLESIQYIMAHHLNITRVRDLYKSKWKRSELSDSDIDHIGALCQQRLRNCPIQYILGTWQFRELTLRMQPPVFIPRPETEILTDIVLTDVRKRRGRARILVGELCCGSGAISLSLLHEAPDDIQAVVACDKSPTACELTLENARKHSLDNRLTVHQYEIGSNKSAIFRDAMFDVIVCNPPYIPSGDLEGLQREILDYEDHDALDGGRDGLDLVRCILSIADVALTIGGRLYMEVDVSHPPLIQKMVTSSGLALKYNTCYRDFNNVERFVEIVKV